MLAWSLCDAGGSKGVHSATVGSLDVCYLLVCLLTLELVALLCMDLMYSIILSAATFT
jgi:hypothetical protein